MSTIITRVLSKTDRFDRQAVRVDASAYKEKWGIIEITVTNYISAGSPAGGNVDVRVPNYNPVNDTVAASFKNISGTPGTVAINTKVYIAVNNGNPGPSVKVNEDGTWDLLWLTYTLAEGNTVVNGTITLTHTVTFTDLTPVANPATLGWAFLAVSPDNPRDECLIGHSSASLGTFNGYIKVYLNQIASTVVDRTLPAIADLDAVGMKDDPPANFFVNSGAGDCVACAQTKGLVVAKHALAKVAGLKVYSKAMLILAVNGGKIDGNGVQPKGTNAQAVAIKCVLESVSDDTVNLTVEHTLSFIPM